MIGSRLYCCWGLPIFCNAYLDRPAVCSLSNDHRSFDECRNRNCTGGEAMMDDMDDGSTGS
jgi:hypothetical protein